MDSVDTAQTAPVTAPEAITTSPAGSISELLRPTHGAKGAHWLPWGVVAAAVGVAALRLPFVGVYLGSDEAGYLTVAGQWKPGGTSLYGNYWVDRPPLLITIFRAADLLGGTVALRLIGVLAAVVTVLAIGATLSRLRGPRAATWAAVAAAAFLATPLTGAREINGELLAAPFIAVGVAALVHTTLHAGRHERGRSTVAAGLLAGACAVAAVLVKQNMFDVVVFAGVLALVAWRELGVGTIVRTLAGFAAGAAAMVAATAAWTLAHGTSLSGVWFAMYPFRLAADRVLAAYAGSGTTTRAHALLGLLLVNGMVLAAALLVVLVAVGRRDHPRDPRSRIARRVSIALLVTLGYDALSIYLGGGYWTHYMVQLIVPLALGIGLVAARWRHVGRAATLLIAVGAAVATIAVDHGTYAAGNPAGTAVARVARPGDTIVGIWGHPEVTRQSGLSSPYPYLWYLPTRTLDPHFARLEATLRGRHAPTWFVTKPTWTRVHGVDTSALSRTVARHYHRVAVIGGRIVYLRDGVHRSTPG